jgi:hypothetical protein
MKAHPCNFLLSVTVAAFAATGAVAQTAETSVGPSASAPNSPAAPDLSGVWSHPFLPGFEPSLSGPGPVTNMVRRRDGRSNWDRLVGDYNNPILKPAAAETIKKYGEISLAGVVYPTPANQCWPQPVPYIFWNLGMQMLQQPHQITMIYDKGDEVRHVRLDQPHPATVTPSWYGDSVGHYEGDTLVIDTVGVKTGRPFAMVDVYGTPYSERLHVIERYRLVDHDSAMAALERRENENFQIPINDSGLVVNPSYRGKALQLEFTVEDDGVFTTPWTGVVTYRRGFGDWPEFVCSENIQEYYYGKTSEVPHANKSDF